MKKRKSRILVLFLAVLLVSVMSCENPFLKKMLVEEEKGKTVPEKPQAPFIEGGASLILSPDKLDIQVKAVTSDGSAVAVEGCTETTLASSNSTYTVLHAKGTRVILKGNIIELYCGSYNDHDVWNKLAALNVQGLSSLQELYCGYNLLSTLNIQGLSALQELSCYGNLLTELNVQGLTALKRLICWNNQLTELNVQGLTALKRLHCSGNQLTALDVQGCTALQTLDCFANQLTALNVQGLTTLEGLVCYGNQLTELNVQGLTTLERLVCYGNQLTALNVQGLNNLRSLKCGDNGLTSLNVQGCTALVQLYCSGNQLTALNAQGCTALHYLYCGNNQLTELNVQGLTALKELFCGGNQLNADAFKKLFDDLPQRADSDDAKCILYTERTGVTEGNHTDFTAPPDLKDAFNNAKNNKKWKMYKRDGSGSWVEL